MPSGGSQLPTCSVVHIEDCLTLRALHQLLRIKVRGPGQRAGQCGVARRWRRLPQRVTGRCGAAREAAGRGHCVQGGGMIPSPHDEPLALFFLGQSCVPASRERAQHAAFAPPHSNVPHLPHPPPLPLGRRHPAGGRPPGAWGAAAASAACLRCPSVSGVAAGAATGRARRFWLWGFAAIPTGRRPRLAGGAPCGCKMTDCAVEGGWSRRVPPACCAAFRWLAKAGPDLALASNDNTHPKTWGRSTHAQTRVPRVPRQLRLATAEGRRTARLQQCCSRAPGSAASLPGAASPWRARAPWPGTSPCCW